MDAMIGNMRSTLGIGVRKMFSNATIGAKNNATQGDKAASDQQSLKMPSLCNICELEDSTVPFIVRDICKFICEKCIKLEGIFRVSAPVRQVNELRTLYESNTNCQDDLLVKQQDATEVTGHAAAGLLKQFFRLLTEPLIHEDVLRIFVECKALSDKEFCDKIRLSTDNWPTPHRRTLLFLLSFLHTVAQESENRMSVNGLGVVFGPNVFKLPDGIEGLQAQTIANQAFQRLLSCSYILCKEESTTPPTKKQAPLRPAPPRPAPPTRRPLPAIPGEVSPPSSRSPRTPSDETRVTPPQENVSHMSVIVKPVPAARRSVEARTSAVESGDALAAAKTIESPRNNGLPKDVKAILVDAKLSDAGDNVAPPQVMPRHKTAADHNVINEQTSNITQMNKKPRLHSTPQSVPHENSVETSSPGFPRIHEPEYEEIPEDFLRQANSGESQLSNDSCSVLDNSIHAVVRTRLFNSVGSMSSVSDDADSSQRNGLLPATTAGRDRGPNRRRPTRKKPLLSNVELDNSDDDDVIIKPLTHLSPENTKPSEHPKTNVTVTTEKDYVITNPPRPQLPTSSSSMPVASSVSPSTHPAVASTSATTVTTPDSGCIVDEFPRNSSPIKSELQRLDIGRGLSPVHIPKLNLQNSMDEDEMNKLGDRTPSPCIDVVPQLDLSSVTESADREIIKPVLQPIVDVEQPIRTPPRPNQRQKSTSNQGTKKKKRKQPGHRKPVKIPEATPQVSDSEILDGDCEETMEQTRDRVSRNLRDNRRIAGRPYDITKMAIEELKEEKMSMQKELLKFEARHGRPTTKEAKHIMREIYDRYRAIKRLLAANENRDVDENENAIPSDLRESFLVTRPFDHQSCDESDVTQEGVLDTPTSDLLNNLRELRSRRKRLRRILRDFESERKSEGSNLQRRVMRTEYDEYRSIKAKVRELEVALARKGVEIF